MAFAFLLDLLAFSDCVRIWMLSRVYPRALSILSMLGLKPRGYPLASQAENFSRNDGSPMNFSLNFALEQMLMPIYWGDVLICPRMRCWADRYSFPSFPNGVRRYPVFVCIILLRFA